jgi:hypothetical protein
MSNPMMLVLTGASQVPARDDATTCGGALKKHTSQFRQQWPRSG